MWNSRYHTIRSNYGVRIMYVRRVTSVLSIVSGRNDAQRISVVFVVNRLPINIVRVFILVIGAFDSLLDVRAPLVTNLSVLVRASVFVAIEVLLLRFVLSRLLLVAALKGTVLVLNSRFVSCFLQ